MFKRVIQSAWVFGVAGGLAIVLPPTVQAQVTVTGGNLTFQGTQIYVPNSAGVNSVIYNGSAGVVVNTSAIPSINNTVLLRGQILPVLNTAPGAVPKVGDTGTWLPTLTFVGRSSTGEPTLFTNIPAELNFTVTGLTPTGASAAINRFASFPFLLSQTGRAVNASSFGGVERITPVVFVEFGQTPSPFLNNIGVASVTPGTNYPGDVNANITGGTLSVPLVNSIGGLNSSPPGNGASNNGSNGSFTVTAATYIGAFNSVTSVYSVYGPTVGTSGDGSTPGSPSSTPGSGSTSGSTPGSTTGTSGNGKEDDDTIFVDPGTKTRVVVVGLPSRVFPGVIGVEVIRDD